MGFGNDAIAVVTRGLKRSTGSFAERLVSYGLIGDILSGPAPFIYNSWVLLLKLLRR